MKRKIKISILFLFLAFVVYGVSAIFQQVEVPGASAQALAKRTEKQLQRIIKDYESVLENDSMIHDLLQNRLASKYFNDILAKPYVFLIYQGEELIFWNENIIIPPDFLVNAIGEGSNSIKLQNNGYYEIAKQVRPIDGKQYTFLRLIPLRTNYSVQNKYLKNRPNPLFNLPDYADISLSDEQGAAVMNPDGKALCYLTINEAEAVEYSNYSRIAAITFALIFLLISLHYLALFLSSSVRPWLGLAFLAITFVVLRSLMIVYDYPSELYDLQLFSPQLYASSNINKSLGDLFLNILLCFWIVYFFFRNVHLNRLKPKGALLNYGIAILIYLLLFTLSYGMIDLFESLLLDSKIPFDFNDFLSLNIYSLFGFLCISLTLMGFLLLVRKGLGFITKKTGLNDRKPLYILLASFAIFIIILVFKGYVLNQIISLFTILLLIVFVQRILTRGLAFTSLSNLLFALILLAVFSATNLYYYNGIKDLQERKALARKLSIERDLITEYLFIDIQEKILNDLFIRNYFRKPFISTQEILERIENKYFSGFFSKYDVNVYTLNKDGKLLMGSYDEYLNILNDELMQSAQQTISDYLFYIPKPGGNYAYISNLPIIYRGKLIGSVVLELVPKTYSKTNLYPELLLEEQVKPVEIYEHYSYALYSSNNLLLKKSGNYPYKYNYSFAEPRGQDFMEVEEGDLTHLIFETDDQKKVVVTSQKDSILQPVSLFSYFFCIYLLFSVVILLGRLIVRSMQSGHFLENIFNISFKDKIQLSMISIIVFSFFVIGYITIRHFIDDYNLYHEERLIRKKQAVRSAIEYIIKDDKTIIASDISPGVKRNTGPIDLVALSDIHAMDINIYDLEGKLVNTSQPEIFEKGLLSNMMHPAAYKNLKINKTSQYIQDETIGTLDYLSIYSPIRSIDGDLVAYLNLPYFAKERELNQEISFLLVTLINVYVFLLVVGGLFAYLLSDSITKSLTAISEKLKFVELGKKNRPIEWKGRDEIGTLVAEYNKMISELERSAEKLAKTERESAWREMAKQIAHEIKNPLTPMKLSIQHLQRALAENDPKAPDLAKRVTATLIEQIENLSHIASEFSSFAKMPRAQNEVVNLSEVMQSVVDLFGEEKNLKIEYVKPKQEFEVYADKSQMFSVFNNLVKNASQAIPHEREGHIRIKMFSENGSVRTAIIDNGTGIPEDQQSKVFVTKFTTKSGGTGLGLALSKQIVENAKGDIWFESKEDEGTTFYVDLPEYKN